jgi:type VII secretion protein EccE
VREATSKLNTIRLGRRAGAPGVVHVIVVELALGTALAGVLIGDPVVMAATGVVAVLLLVGVFFRADGRWWYESAGARWRLRRRRAAIRRLNARQPAEPRAVALSTLAPRLAIRAVTDRGRTIGIGQDEDGWFAGVLVGADGLSSNGPIRLELDKLVRMLDDTSIPISALQLVSYATLTPSETVDGSGAAVRSYRELVASGGYPLEQTVWLAVRLTPADALEASMSRGGGINGVDRAIAAVIGRLEKMLTSAGISHQVLDVDGLRDALTVSCGLEQVGTVAAAGGDPPARERWVNWQAGGMRHVTFSVSDWPREPNPDLLSQLSVIPASAVSVVVALRPYGDRTAFLGLVRVVAPPDRSRAAIKQLNRTADRLGLGLRRLDGEQAQAVYATAPTGVGGIW